MEFSKIIVYYENIKLIVDKCVKEVQPIILKQKIDNGQIITNYTDYPGENYRLKGTIICNFITNTLCSTTPWNKLTTAIELCKRYDPSFMNTLTPFANLCKLFNEFCNNIEELSECKEIAKIAFGSNDCLEAFGLQREIIYCNFLELANYSIVIGETLRKY